MRIRPLVPALVLGSTIMFALAALGAGCTSSSDEGANESDASTLVCPRTLLSAKDSKCSQEGAVCGVNYDCGQFLSEQATCTCTGGVFACTDSRGKPIADLTAAPKCVSQGGGNDSQCPGDEPSADGKACTTAGLQCFYKGQTCPETGVTNVDVCECTGAAGSGGLQFKCEKKACATPSDASVPLVDSGSQG